MTTLQLDLFDCPDHQFFTSGASATRDLRGYAQAGRNVGVCLLDLSRPAQQQLLAEMGTGTRAFVDSGEFRAFRSRLRAIEEPSAKVIEINWERTLERYQQLAQCPFPENLTVVAPDIIADQAGTLSLVEEYRDELRDILDCGAKVTFPLQAGERDLLWMYDRIRDVMGVSQLHVALPSNEAALSWVDIARLLKYRTPLTVHFLGTSNTELLNQAHQLNPAVTFTYDATRITAKSGQGKPLTVRQHHLTLLHGEDAIAGAGLFPEYDWTEACGYLDDVILNLDRKALGLLAIELGDCTPRQLLDAARRGNNEVWELMDTLHHGYAFQVLQLAWERFTCRQLSPHCRTLAVAQLARENVL